MNDQPRDPVNIGPGQRRLRLMIGIVTAVVGVVSAVLLLVFDVHPYWRLILFLPFWGGALGILQYRDGIWVGLVARGTRDFGEGQEPIGNDQLQDLLQSRARSLQGYALAIGLALTAILFFFPHPFP